MAAAAAIIVLARGNTPTIHTQLCPPTDQQVCAEVVLLLISPLNSVCLLVQMLHVGVEFDGNCPYEGLIGTKFTSFPPTSFLFVQVGKCIVVPLETVGLRDSGLVKCLVVALAQTNRICFNER